MDSLALRHQGQAPQGPPSGQGAGGGDRTRERKVPADLRLDSLATVPPTPSASVVMRIIIIKVIIKSTIIMIPKRQLFLRFVSFTNVKDDVSPLEMAEEESLMWKMMKAFNLDRDVYPVILSSAFIARKELNYIGTDGLLIFVTSQQWSASEQFFFCKRVRPSEAQPLIPLRWNEHFYSDVYHYR
ncbi:hypothetical protein PoB_003379400 [Plakobranchus ocellatus]|uniref:Uncharacterized protein n=1 Tax=Plakobranchus ocellatus TaxID=259542 RepID=A0AAV4AM30_9GAST|nr:hypothetical protein PoB_003379400 [Plakobranchus ocellatus]